MATKKKATAIAAITLAFIVTETLAERYPYTTPEFHAPLVAAGYVETNPENPGPEGQLLTRATQKAIDEYNANLAANPVAETAVKSQPVARESFQIENAKPIPEISGRGRTSVFPFDQLNVGQSFFVANDAKRPNAAQSMASTVAGANARHSEVVVGEFRKGRGGKDFPVTKQLRQFVVRAVEEQQNGSLVKGARVWRTS